MRRFSVAAGYGVNGVVTCDTKAWAAELLVLHFYAAFAALAKR